MPMFLWRIIPQELLQTLGYNVSAISNQQFRHHFFLHLSVHSIKCHIEVLHRNTGNGLVSNMLCQPGKMLVKQLRIFLFEQINQIHLSDNNHTLLILIEPLDKIVIIPVINIQTLITGDNTYFRKCLSSKTEYRFSDRNINMHRTFAMMMCLQQCFVNQTITIPFVFIRIDFRKVN